MLTARTQPWAILAAVLLLAIGAAAGVQTLFSWPVGGNLYGLTAGATFNLTSAPTTVYAEENVGNTSVRVLHLLARGTDGNVWQLKQIYGIWREWRSLGIPTADSVGAAHHYNNPWTTVGVRNSGNTVSVWSVDLGTGARDQRANLGGNMVSGTSVVPFGSSHSSTDLFVRGNNNGIWLRRESIADQNTDWRFLGGDKRYAPGAVQLSTTQGAVFATGSDGALWMLPSNGTGWGDWRSLGGSLTSGPAAVHALDDLVHVFARGSSGQLMHTWGNWRTGQWFGWQDLGGSLSGAPTATTSGSNKIEVYITGPDQQARGRRWNGSAWSPWFKLGEDPTRAVLTVRPSDHAGRTVSSDDLKVGDILPYYWKIDCTYTNGARDLTRPCELGLDVGTVVRLHVTNRDGAFKAWGGDCAHAGASLTCTLTMTGNKAVWATYN